MSTWDTNLVILLYIFKTPCIPLGVMGLLESTQLLFGEGGVHPERVAYVLQDDTHKHISI